MAEALKLVRIFLGSPGDVKEERTAATEVINELNSTVANNLGFQLQLFKWENAVRGTGRAQSIINKELSLCELFIGLLHKKWGTPTGDYSSGFDEEFSISSSRYQETGKPEIKLYFKKIGQDWLDDPTEDVKKILKFKEEIQTSNFYGEFDDIKILETHLRKDITAYLFSLSKLELIKEEEIKETKTDDADSKEFQENNYNPFSEEGYEFLKSFLQKAENDSELKTIDAAEIARFRLLASSVSKQGNQEPFLGAHDANILFTHKDKFVFGYKECSSLIDVGIKNLSHENTPLWHWYLKAAIDVPGILAYKSLDTSEEEKSKGALLAMRRVASKIPENETLTREFFIKSWLGESTPKQVIVAALKYLADYGVKEDLKYIKEVFERGDYNTAQASIEATIAILFRYNESAAMEYAFTTSFSSIDGQLIEMIRTSAILLTEDILRLGVKHTNKYIRKVSLLKLIDIDKFSKLDAELLFSDEDPEIRSLSLNAYVDQGNVITDEEAKKILVKPKRHRGFGGLFGFGAPQENDEEGEKNYKEFLLKKFGSYSETQLKSAAKANPIYSDTPYFELCKKYFSKHGKQLRKNIDNKFSDYFSESIEKMAKELNLAADSDLLKKIKDLEDFLRKELSRKGLNILVKKGGKQDLSLLKKLLQENYVGLEKSDFLFLKKHASWEDIEWLLQMNDPVASARSILSIGNENDFYEEIAKVAVHVAKGRINELLELEIPPKILTEALKHLTQSDFQSLTSKQVMNLLYSGNEQVRKLSCFKCIQFYNKKKLKELLDEYLNTEKHRFYNVIHWLDFGVSIPKNIGKKAVQNLLLSQ